MQIFSITVQGPDGKLFDIPVSKKTAKDLLHHGIQPDTPLVYMSAENLRQMEEAMLELFDEDLLIN